MHPKSWTAFGVHINIDPALFTHEKDAYPGRYAS